jgi:hypothetical protein
VKMQESWCSETTNFACYYWACDLALCQCIFFYQPIGGWFWKSPRISRLFMNVLIHTF